MIVRRKGFNKQANRRACDCNEVRYKKVQIDYDYYSAT